MTGAWLGKAAVLWTFDDAPAVPPHLVAALVAVARYADENGRGAHPSAYTAALHIRKTERSAKKDLAELRQLGLLLPGDQRITAGIRADKRPFVYDLPMPRGVAQDTPRGNSGVSRRTGRGVPRVPSGVSHRTPKESLKNSSKRARGHAADAPPHAQPPPRFFAPPCVVCGKPFSETWLKDLALRQMIFDQEVVHVECQDEDNRRYEAAHPEEAGQ